MNERKFLRAINHKYNDTGSFTYGEVGKLLEESKELSANTKENIFRRLFAFRYKTAKQIIQDNFEHILDRCCDDYVGNLLILLWNDKTTRDIIHDKFDSILERFKHNKLFEDDEFWALGSQQERFFKELSKSDEGKEIIQDSFEDILPCIPKSYLFEIAQSIKNISPETDDILDQYLQANDLNVAKSLLDDRRIVVRGDKNYLLNEYAITILTMINELLESENARWVDISDLGKGGYSSVYQIGEKVLKVGADRKTYNMPNHTRILQPLTRINLIDERNYYVPFAVVEIADKVDKLKDEDDTEETLYGIYRELREDGIIWTDARFDNIGVLKKSNTPNLHGENMYVSPNFVGIIGTIKGKALQKGDIVILDTDYIYSQDDPAIVWPKDGFSRGFEKRWQQECQERISKMHAGKIEEPKIEERGEKDEQY